MKTIAITGANGFVGKSLIEFFSGKYNIIPITRITFNLLNSYETKQFFESHKVDVIIHCANEGGSRKTGYDKEMTDVVTNNLKMYYHLNSILTPEIKMISFGSGAQYFKARNLEKVGEHSIGDFIPEDSYGFSKYVISKNIDNKDQVYSPIIFGLFGRNEDYRFKFISNAIIKNILKMPIIINQNVVFDYLYINDFLTIIEKYIEHEYKHKQFNITPTDSIDLISIAKLINNCSDFKSEIIVKNPGLNFEYTASNDRMINDIGSFAFTSYEESISQLYHDYKENIGNIDTECIRQDKFIEHCKVKKDEKN